jgi:outer membrane cobalamin receptor
LTLKNRLSGTVAVLALLPVFAAVPALAQTAPDQVAQSAPQTETIEVTGSRLKTSDAASANPITVVSAEDIAKTSATTVEEVLMKLPSVDFTAGFTANSSNGGVGASQASLRNLGPVRTLILLNGQRFPLTDVQQATNSVDLGNIPVSMIDHIEVLRDGASSIYGADAIGGVINIITKQHFNGVEIGGGVGETSYGDGLRHNVYSTAGADFDRGNILINVSTDHADAISQGARAWAVSQHPEADAYNYTQISSRGTGVVGLLPTGPGGTNQSWYWGNGGIGSGILSSNAYQLGANQISPGVWTGGGLSPGDLALEGLAAGHQATYFNYLPTQGLTAGYDKQQMNFTAHYDLTPNVTAVIEGFYTDRQSNEILNPEPLGYNVTTPQFPNGLYVAGFLPDGTPNPYNPTNPAVNPNAAALYGGTNLNIPILTRRFENGPRYYTDDVETYRIRTALQGTLMGKYDWEVGYFYGKSDATYNVANEANFYKLSQELGMNPCGSNPGCSVANFFGYNTLTPAQAKYFSFTNTDTSGYTEQDAYGHIGGTVYNLPAGPLGVVVGFEYRPETLFDHPDSITSQGDGATYSLPTSGNYATSSGYVEVNAPLLSNLPFVKMLTADVSTRYDYNTTFGRALTYKAGLDYAIDDDFRLRGGRSTGFRAPQLRELYSGASQGQVGGSDPCATGQAFAGNAACLASLPAGVTTSALVAGSQVTEATGGNPALHPETSQEWTIGGVATPHWVPGLSVSMDYYTVLIRNEISAYDPNSLLAACFGGVPYLVSQQVACQLVGPRTSSGALGPIKAINANIGAENTDGLDLDLSYGIDTAKMGLPAWGHLTFNGQVNYLLSDNVSAGGVTQQQAGTWSGDNGEPRFKALANLQFSRDNWTVGWTTRYYGGLKAAPGTVTPDPAVASNYDANGNLLTCGQLGNPKGCGDWEGNEAAGVFYHDISVAYQYKNVNVTVGVDNLFDKDPPFLYPTGQSNAPGSAGYDFTGRFIYTKMSVKF